MVWFVGAGPGDPKLLTIAGKEKMEAADVVIYAGSLVNPALLSYAKKDAEIHNSAYMTLDEVIAVIEQAEQEGKTTVRLHTGDPSMYGAIREQIDRLKERGITWEIVPGVSSVFAAAAALGLEFTLPGVSQTLILTREAGRTPVPETEQLATLAAHQASMVLFLSVGMAEKVQADLMAGGYHEKTPCAIVYKASWEDQRIVRGTVGTLAQMAAENGITKTALILIGEALGACEGFAQEKDGAAEKDSAWNGERPYAYERSRLYAPDFTTGYRTAKTGSRIAIISYTENGRLLGEKIAAALNKNTKESVRENHSGNGKGKTLEGSFGNVLEGGVENTSENTIENGIESVSGKEIEKVTVDCYAYRKDFTNTQELLTQIFPETEVLLFISAAGIAVREIAPHLKSKAEDPAVLCADERGLHVISLLSGHLGGANEWCERIARIIGADPVITTATDLHRVFAVDLFAKEQRLVFKDTATIKEVSARLLRGEKVGYFSEAEAYKTPPAELSPHLVQGEETPNCGITIALTENLPRQFPVECRLYPKNLYLGIGCKKGKTKEELYHFLQEVFEKNKLPQKRIAALCSIREKEDEAGLCALAETLRVPFYTYPADELAALTGDFTESEFVSKTVGVGNVCERSAVRAAGPDAPLILRKTAHEGMTLAVAERRNL